MLADGEAEGSVKRYPLLFPCLLASEVLLCCLRNLFVICCFVNHFGRMAQSFFMQPCLLWIFFFLSLAGLSHSRQLAEIAVKM